MLLVELGYDVLDRIDNSAEAIECILSQMPDLILMDIDIKGRLSGLEIAEHIRHLEIPILFITGYDDHETYQRAQNANMIAYLVKPVNQFSLKSAIRLALESVSDGGDRNYHTESLADSGFLKKDYFFFKDKDAYRKVSLREIAYFQADGDYVLAHTNDQKYMARMKFAELQEMLPENQFMQVHRSFIIRLKEIESVNFKSNIITVKNGEIPISRTFRDSLRDSIVRLK